MTREAPVAVVGLGLIGGSLARALAARGLPVVATDVSGATRDASRAAGLDVTDDVAGLVRRRPGIIVLAAPLRALRSVAGEVARALAEAGVDRAGTAEAGMADGADGWDPTVTDVGSVKGPVRQAVTDAGLGARFVGAHPMAGTERSGFAASDDALLVGARWAVTVDRATDPRRLEQLLRLVTGDLGGSVAVLTDDLHDEAAALVSHVPHVLANQLLGTVATAPVRDLALWLAAGSFRDGTRVAFGDPRRTEAMVTENAAWVAPVLRLAARDLEALADALDANAPVHRFFDRPAAVRDAWPRTADAEAVEPVPLTGDWPATLVARCAAGVAVVALEDDLVILS